MKQFNTGSLKFKMVLYSTLCVALVGILSNLYLYAYFNRIIAEKEYQD